VVKEIAIEPGTIATIRTSVERVLGAAPAAPFEQATDLPAYWRAAVERHGEDLALRIASELPVGSFGRASYAFASAATIGDALASFRRDSQRVATGITIDLGIEGEDAELVLRGPELVWPLFEILLGVLALRCQQLPQPPVPITRVVLPRRAPADVAPWQKLFTVVPQFGARHGALVIPAALLDRPLRTADPAVRAALGSGPIATITDEVRAHVREWIRESPEADEVARALGLSTRTLQRRLGEAGTSFRDVVLAVKIDVAKELLERPNLSIAEVASAVGFSRVPAFSRAFSQRTGLTPSAYRAQLRK
jgi:AraC-like DNA-binding protein